VERGLERVADVLLEKGLLVHRDGARRSKPTPSVQPTQRGVILDEFASKTTPTCVSNYLR